MEEIFGKWAQTHLEPLKQALKVLQAKVDAAPGTVGGQHHCLCQEAGCGDCAPVRRKIVEQAVKDTENRIFYDIGVAAAKAGILEKSNEVAQAYLKYTGKGVDISKVEVT